MDSFEWNKIFMGLGFAVLGVLGINELTKALVHAERPEKTAIAIEGVEQVADAGGAEEAAPVMPDWGVVLASADVARGEQIAGQCATCHQWTADRAGGGKQGPNLYAIVGAKHAHIADFNYSEAMKSLSDKPWTYDELYQFIERPSGYIRGTKMQFAGIRKSEDRVALIAYMRTWAEPGQEFPIPAPRAAEPAAAPAEGAAAPAEGTAPAAPAEGAASEGAVPTPPPGEAAPAPEAPEAAPAATGAQPTVPGESAPASEPAPPPAGTTGGTGQGGN